MKALSLFFILALLAPISAAAGDSSASVVTEKAHVLSVLGQSNEAIAGTSVTALDQSLSIEIVGGPDTGALATIDNDAFASKPGDIIYVKHTVDPANGVDSYAATDPDRLPILALFVGIFVVCAVVFGGKQGSRGLVALALGLSAIAAVLFPAILAGYSPMLAGMGVAALIVIVGSYITHSLNKATTAAVVGMVLAILLTGGLTWLGIHSGRLTGLATEEAVYLNFDTGGRIDFASLLGAGILIGLLGILYDAAIGQAAAVDELAKAGPHLSRAAIFKSALRIGREHIGALINSLALAYVGASLPLLLLFYSSPSSTPILATANSELFATEIIRAMIGSIGLILAVPITTAVAVLMLVRRNDNKQA